MEVGTCSSPWFELHATFLQLLNVQHQPEQHMCFQPFHLSLLLAACGRYTVFFWESRSKQYGCTCIENFLCLWYSPLTRKQSATLTAMTH